MGTRRPPIHRQDGLAMRAFDKSKPCKPFWVVYLLKGLNVAAMSMHQASLHKPARA